MSEFYNAPGDTVCVGHKYGLKERDGWGWHKLSDIRTG